MKCEISGASLESQNQAVETNIWTVSISRHPLIICPSIQGIRTAIFKFQKSVIVKITKMQVQEMFSSGASPADETYTNTLFSKK